MSTYASSDAATDLVLNFIAGGVPGNLSGESTGNYNSVIGDAHASDDLSLRSLDEIYSMMSALLEQGRPSTAIGRYQIIRSTLQGLQAKLGLSNTTKFTPALQDRLALELLKGRGYERWWTGGMSDVDFAHGLSCEWASLPDPEKDGKSHYEGQHASTTLETVYGMLAHARSLKPTPAPPQPAPTPPPAPQPPVNADAAAVIARLDTLIAAVAQMVIDIHRTAEILDGIFRKPPGNNSN